MLQPDQRPNGKRVLLMGTCLCDAFFPDAAKAAVEVLEHVGCEVVFPREQTCCGQPPFNSGDFQTSRRIALHTADVFEGELPVIVPSGSCAAMHFHGNRLQFEGVHDRGGVESLASRTWELFDYLVNGIGVTEWEGQLRKRVAIHHSCHTRGTGTGSALRQLLSSIEGLEITEFGQKEQCCGFGGTFSVTFPHISSAMGTIKLDHIIGESPPDVIVSSDMSCLMHLSGLAEKQSRPLETKHAAEILAATLQP